jgi:hypothetical protein
MRVSAILTGRPRCLAALGGSATAFRESASREHIQNDLTASGSLGLASRRLFSGRRGRRRGCGRGCPSVLKTSTTGHTL